MNQKTLLTIVAILAVAATVFASIWMTRTGEVQPETTIIYCGPNQSNPVLVFRNPSKAFPAFVDDYAMNLKAGLDVLQKLHDSLSNSAIDLSVKRQVVELRDKLNQDNINFENVLKSAFYAYNAHPCDKSAYTSYMALVSDMSNKITELKKIKSIPDTIAYVQSMTSAELLKDLKAQHIIDKKDLDSFKRQEKIPQKSSMVRLPPKADSNFKSLGSSLKLNEVLSTVDNQYFQSRNR